jgi:hypothetical protein
MIAFYAFSMLPHKVTGVIMLCAMAAAMAYTPALWGNTPALWGLARLGRLNWMVIDTI